MGGTKISYREPSAEERALTQRQVEALEMQNKLFQQSWARQQQLEPLMYELAGIAPTRDEAGNITGFTRTQSESEKAAERILGLQLEREEQALRGELPVNPAWTSQKEEILAQFEEGAQRHGLKPGDTGYDVAKSKLATQLAGTEYGLRTGDIGLYEGLSLGRSTQQAQQTQQLLGQYSMLPASITGAGQTFGQAAAGYNDPRSWYQGNRELALQASWLSSQVPRAFERWGRSGGALGMIGLNISDGRVKRVLAKLYDDLRGFGVYLFQYVWDPRVYQGVIAQEVAAVVPAAVVPHPSGLLLVDYDRL